jgi:hypothetical protein
MTKKLYNIFKYQNKSKIGSVIDFCNVTTLFHYTMTHFCTTYSSTFERLVISVTVITMQLSREYTSY